MHGSLSRCIHEELKSLLERFYEGKEKEQAYICMFASKCLSLPTHQDSACRVLTSLPFQFSPSSPLAAMRKPYPMLISMVKVLTKQRRAGLGNLASAKIMLNTLLKEKATQILIQLLLQTGITYRKQCCLCLFGIQSPVLWVTVLYFLSKPPFQTPSMSQSELTPPFIPDGGMTQPWLRNWKLAQGQAKPWGQWLASPQPQWLAQCGIHEPVSSLGLSFETH